VLIVCEGEKTEPSYFEDLRKELRLTPVDVEVVGKECGSAPISVVDHAIQARGKREKLVAKGSSPSAVRYDEVWCVFDTEDPRKTSTLDAAIDKARRQQLQTAISRPCFEYWYLLHFEDSSRPERSCEPLKKRLRRKHWQEYSEKVSDFTPLRERRQEAIERAERLLQRCVDPDEKPVPNPSTTVWRLVQVLLEMKPPGC